MNDGTSLIGRWALPLAAALAFGALVVAMGTRNASTPASGTTGFAAEVDLRPLGAVAVHSEGRLKSFESFASGTMQFVSGPKRIAGQSPGFTYLDLLFRPGAYDDADIIYVKNKPVRQQMADAMIEARPELAERMETFVQTGLVSERIVLDEALRPLIDAMQADLVRTERVVRELSGALAVRQSDVLLQRLRFIPPPYGDLEQRWHGIDEIMPAPVAPRGGSVPAPAAHGHAHGHGAGADFAPPGIMGLEPEHERVIAAHWQDLVNGWGRQDPRMVNAAVIGLSETLSLVNPEIYPAQGRLAMESWYFSAGNMSWIWVIYLIGTMPLLMWAVYRWPGALRLGLSLFTVAFLLQTTAVLIRWYISGRWPNSNMFEAVTTAAWFGAVAALVLEIGLRRTGFRGLFALGAAVASMVALMAAHFLPAYLNPNISNMMPVLHDIWLYIHVNVIIFSYCLIFMAAVSAVLYLGWRFFGGAPVYARVGGAGSLIVPNSLSPAFSVAAPISLGRDAAVLEAGTTGGAIGDPRNDHLSDPRGPGADARQERTRLGEIFDGTTMILMEGAFVLLWAGLVMGAIWADHSWGRPWGWDPKEVFALNTFLVFAVLIHVRLKVRDKGFWTAILAIVGAGVMLFNWIVINFVITGLHSYA